MKLWNYFIWLPSKLQCLPTCNWEYTLSCWICSTRWVPRAPRKILIWNDHSLRGKTLAATIATEIREYGATRLLRISVPVRSILTHLLLTSGFRNEFTISVIPLKNCLYEASSDGNTLAGTGKHTGSLSPCLKNHSFLSSNRCPFFSQCFFKDRWVASSQKQIQHLTFNEGIFR